VPLYEYECSACGQRFEIIQKFTDPAPDACAKCGKGPVTRLMSSPAIQFKGTGWYITDYAQKGKSNTPATSSGETKKSDAGGDSSSSAKSESTPAAPAAKSSSSE